MQIICKVCFNWCKCQIRIINQDYKKIGIWYVYPSAKYTKFY